MAKSRYISDEFWSDSYIENLKPLHKLLFMYFLTCEKNNLIGIYRISIKRIMFDTGLKKDEIIQGIKDFSVNDKIHYLNEYIVIVNFIKYQTPNTNMKKGMETLLNGLPSIIKALLISGKSSVCDIFSVSFGMVLKGFEGLETVMEAFETLNSNININKNININLIEKVAPKSDPLKKSYMKNFEVFYKAYPKHKNKGNAEKAWKKLKPDDDLLNLMLQKIKQLKATSDWQKEDGKYIPYPSKWLNGKGWEDEVVNNIVQQKKRTPDWF